jgi:hypothetical protein
MGHHQLRAFTSKANRLTRSAAPTRNVPPIARNRPEKPLPCESLPDVPVVPAVRRDGRSFTITKQPEREQNLFAPRKV